MNHEKWAARFEDLLKDDYAQVYDRLAKDIQAARDDDARCDESRRTRRHSTSVRHARICVDHLGNCLKYIERDDRVYAAEFILLKALREIEALDTNAGDT